jgi:hypothetical protein
MCDYIGVFIGIAAFGIGWIIADIWGGYDD